MKKMATKAREKKESPEKTDRKSKKTVSIRAIRKSLPKTMRDRGDLIACADCTFGSAIVYAYGTFEEYNGLRAILFGDKSEIRGAYGYASHGFVRSIPCPCTLVWVNSVIPREQSIPWFSHEISHLADFILEDAKMDDRSGEARAYIIERETKRILEKMFGTKAYHTVTDKQIMEVLK